MKKALGLWLIVLAVVIGGIFFFINSDSEKRNLGKTDKNGDTVSAPNTGEQKQIIKTDYNTNNFFSIAEITSEIEGKTIRTKGYVINLSEGKNNVFFTLVDRNNNRAIKCIMFEKTNNDNGGRKILLEKSNSTRIELNIEGQVAIYKNQLEIKVWKVYTK